MEPQKIYIDPRSNKARITKFNKERRYKCPLCQKSWVNRNEAVNHIKICNQKKVEQMLQNQIIYGQNFDNGNMYMDLNQNFQQVMNNGEIANEEVLRMNEKNQKKINKLQQQLKEMESELTKIKIKIPSLGQIVQFQELQYITNHIVQNQTVVNLIKSTIQSQVYQLVQQGFNISQIIGKGKNILHEKISEIRITESFSKHSNNIQALEKQLQQHYKNRDKPYRSQIMHAFSFIKRFTQRQLKSQTKFIEEISQLSFYKRKNICTLYERLRTVYSDLFKFQMLPLRLSKTEGGNKLRRRKININILFSEIKRLLAGKSFILACDIWMGMCLGLRSNEYKLIKIQRGTGEIAKLIRMTENKNKNIITRVIPRSLANIVKKHDVTYPITEERFSQVRQFCLKQFGTFYGLRSTAISLILSKLAYESQIGRFHSSVSTTGKYYLNTDIEEVVHGIFALQGYDEDLQSNLEVIFEDDYVQFREIIENNYLMDLEENRNSYLQDSEKDSIILADIEQKQLTLINKIRKIELQNNIQAGSDEYSSLNEVLSLSSQYSIQNISELCINENLHLSVIQVDSQSMTIQTVQKIGENGGTQAQLIKTISSESQQGEMDIVYKVDEAKMVRQQILDKINSFKKSKLSLLRSFLKCFQCSKRYIINSCGNHFKISCQIHGDYHICEENSMTGIPVQRQLINTSSLNHELKLNKIQLGKKNNIMDILMKTNKKYTKRILYSDHVPHFKVSMPIGNEDFHEAIKHVEENEQFLPLEIKQTKFGYGVFSTTIIEKNTLVCTYSGVIEQGAFVDNTDDCLVDYGMVKINEKVYNLLLTCSHFCNVGKFFNSSKTFDSKSKNLVLEKTIDGDNRVVNIMFASRKIQKGQQIKWYYGQEYWASSNITPQSDDEQAANQNQQIISYQQSVEIMQQNNEQVVMQINTMQKKKTQVQLIKNVKEKQVKGLIIKFNFRVIECTPENIIEIASIIKILNAKVCIKQIDNKKFTWETEFLMPNYFADRSTRAFLRLNRRYSVYNLMLGMLVPSGCDAAYCLAYNVGKMYNQAQPIAEFVKKMNEEAMELGMTSTKIYQPTGYGNSVSSAKDLMKLVHWMRHQKRLHPILKQKSVNLERFQQNSNKLLHLNILGKTGNGMTDGHSFIGFHQYQNIEIVLLGSPVNYITFSKTQEYLKRIKAQKFP